MRKKISIDTKEKAIKEYYDGKRVKDICIRYKVKKSAVYDWVRKSKKNLMKRDPNTKEKEVLRVVSLVLKGDSVKSVCKRFKLRESTVYAWVNKYQDNILEKRPSIEKKRTENIDKLKLSIEVLKKTSITNDMNNSEKVELITSLLDNYSLTLLCDLFDIHRSTYYRYINKEVPKHIIRDQKLRVLIHNIYSRNQKRIGAEKIREALMIEGHQVSYKKVRQIMKELQIEKKPEPKKQPWIKPPKTNESCKNLLNQQFNQKAPNLVWVSDITETKINNKPVYLCAIMDLFSRKIIAHQISRKNNTRLTILTFKKAIENRKVVPNIFHSDRGSNYTSTKFRKLLIKHNISQSFSAPGYPYDNAVIESFFAQYKRETIKRLLPFKKIQNYIKMAKEYMNWYNNDRFHKGLGMLTPSMKEKIHFKLSLGSI